MAKAWRKWDLKGGGLQSANLALARHRKHHGLAYALWPLFPVGAHALYLSAPRRATLYVSASTLATVLVTTDHRPLALVVLATSLIGAVYDLFWIDRRVTEINKHLRLTLSLRPGRGAPQGFPGHYTDDALSSYLKIKEGERAGHGPATAGAASMSGHAPSFAEQEAQLRARTKKPPQKTGDH